MRPIYLKIIKQKWAQMAKIESLRGCIDRLKQTQKENRQTPKGRKPANDTLREILSKYSNRSQTVKSGLSISPSSHNKWSQTNKCNYPM